MGIYDGRDNVPLSEQIIQEIEWENSWRNMGFIVIPSMKEDERRGRRYFDGEIWRHG